MGELAQFLIDGPNDRCYVYDVLMEREGGRIKFLESPFALKDEIKAMSGSRPHYEDGVFQYWSVDDSYRNNFQIDWLRGGNPYEWFDREVIEFDYPKFGSDGFGYYNLMPQQKIMTNAMLTYHYQIWGAEMALGKTLSAIAGMKLSGKKGFWWVGPKSSLPNIRLEFEKWGLEPDVCPELMTYNGMVSKMKEWKSGDPAPIGVIFDEAHLLKNPGNQRTEAAQKLADSIRDEYSKEGFVIEMTGTPSSKKPGEWWSLCEIAWPGYVKEGSREAFEKRLGFYRIGENLSGMKYPIRLAWRADEKRCDICGHYEKEGHHILENGEIIEEDRAFDTHVWEPSINEVANVYNRLKGLAIILHKKDWLAYLPDIIYKEISFDPKPSLLRVASAISRSAKNTISGLVQLRELSDGFQYRDIEDGYQDCNACTDGTETRYVHPDGTSIYDIESLDDAFVDELVRHTDKCRACDGTQQIVKYKRITREVACPKIDAVVDLLGQYEEQGRLVFFAGFQGSIDRIVKTCHKEGWDTVRVDGRGWDIRMLLGETDEDGSPKTKKVKLDNPLKYWIDPENTKVAFVAHPKSGGTSFTLNPQGDIPGAVASVFYSNDYSADSRVQAIARIHRPGMDETKGATIYDLFHLPSDRKVRDVLDANRKLELMTMGQIMGEE